MYTTNPGTHMSALMNPIKKPGKHAKDRNPRPHKVADKKQNLQQARNDAKAPKAAKFFLSGATPEEKQLRLDKIIVGGDSRRATNIFKLILKDNNKHLAGRDILDQIEHWMQKHSDSVAT